MRTNRPYLLTALHCADQNGNGTMDNIEKDSLSNWQFTFNYKKVCNSNSVVSYVSNTYAGCHFRSAWQPTDFLLVEIKDAITDPNIRFLGWDIATGYPYAPIGIHHPRGDLMKISFDWHTAYSNDGVLYWTEGPDSPKYTHLEVGWDNGATEGGSSGSPLLARVEGDPEYRVVGQLHGGPTQCAPTVDNYGRIGRSWSMGSTKELRLKEWLAPYNTVAIITNSTGPCQSITFENKTLAEDERIVCKNILLQNITINSGATLLLQATESITISPNVVVKTGGTLITEGKLLVTGGYVLEDGASFVVK